MFPDGKIEVYASAFKAGGTVGGPVTVHAIDDMEAPLRRRFGRGASIVVECVVERGELKPLPNGVPTVYPALKG